jgi:hypothetical protein
MKNLAQSASAEDIQFAKDNMSWLMQVIPQGNDDDSGPF